MCNKLCAAGYVLSSAILGVLIVVFIIASTYAPIASKPIISLRSEDNLSGAFILGSGSISTQTFYYTYVATPTGGFNLLKLSSDMVTIFEDAPNEFSAYVTGPWNGRQFASPRVPQPDTFQIHIPPGTIIRQFELK